MTRGGAWVSRLPLGREDDAIRCPTSGLLSQITDPRVGAAREETGGRGMQRREGDKEGGELLLATAARVL